MAPRWLRRLVIAPLPGVALLFAVTTAPLWLLAAALASPLLPGKMRPLRLLLVAIAYLTLESIGIALATMHWLVAGFGRTLDEPRQRARSYRILRLVLNSLVAVAERVLGVTIDVSGDPPPPGQPPAVFLCRHAGPGDSLLLVDALQDGGRHPRIVLKQALRWDPALDILLGRLPNRFVPPGGGGTAMADAIGSLAVDLGEQDALVLFPEGGNFTQERRRRSIARLEASGLTAEAEQARRMRYVLSPRPAGTVAALHAAPADCDVFFVAHAGLDDLVGLVDLWRGLPMDRDVAIRYWHVPAAQVPRDPAAITPWLNQWWERVDGLVGAQLDGAPD